jgi:F0F1-type ATP synthase membrane subunit b/b'
MLQQKASEKKLNKNFTFFTGLIGFCAFVVAGCAAFFSVRGIALLFSGAMIGVLVMASSLEIAKLVTASFLYRYWRQLKFTLKLYLTTAVIILIGITSLGIFGYLSDAFETTKNRVQNYELQIEKLEGDIVIAESKVENITNAKTVVEDRQDEAVDDYKQIYDDFVERKERDRVQIRTRLSELDSERAALEAQGGGLFSNKKKKLEELETRQLEERTQLTQSLQKIDQSIDDEYKLFIEKVNTYKASLIDNSETDGKQELDNLSTEINTKRDRILELKELIGGTDIGSFKFIARAVNMELEDVVKYFILFLVIVFDPLAVTLVLAYNIALLNKQDQ